MVLEGQMLTAEPQSHAYSVDLVALVDEFTNGISGAATLPLCSRPGVESSSTSSQVLVPPKVRELPLYPALPHFGYIRIRLRPA